MTAPGGKSFSQQVEELRGRLRGGQPGRGGGRRDGEGDCYDGRQLRGEGTEMARGLGWGGAAALAGLVLLWVAPDAPRPAAAEQAEPGAGPAAWADDLRPIGPGDWSYDRAPHLLERAGFG